jgi:aryl-alcohol dehydrogenase-like predicted oxidoreductase
MSHRKREKPKIRNKKSEIRSQSTSFAHNPQRLVLSNMMTFLAHFFYLLSLALCTQMLAFPAGYTRRGLLPKFHAIAERDLVQLPGNQPILMPRLGTGTWAWGDKLFWGYNSSQDESLLQAYNASMSKGVNLFDTAEFYGIGKSELLLGRFNRQIYSDSSIKPFFASKFAPLPYRFEKSSVVEACLESRDRLGVAQIDLYQIHWPMPLKNDIYWEGLAECYHKGYVKAVGVSNYGPKLLRSAHSYLKSLGVPLATNQIQYSLLCRTQESNGALRTAEELGVTTLAYSPLAQGILTGKFKLSESKGGSRSALARTLGVVGIVGGDRSQLRVIIIDVKL